MPPYSSGMVKPKSPSSRAFCRRSAGTSSFSSIQRERGSTSARMKRRISSQNARTSAVTGMVYLLLFPSPHPSPRIWGEGGSFHSSLGHYSLGSLGHSSLRHSSLALQLDQRIRRHHTSTLFHHEQRIYIELRHVVLHIDSERGEPHDRIGERLEIGRRPAANSREHGIALDLRDHLACDRRRHGREPERDVLQHFGEDAAQAEHHRRTEQRIVGNAEDDFGAAARHL